MAGAGAPGQRGAGNLAQALRWLSLALVPALVLLFVYDRSFEVTPATAGLQHGGPVHAGAGFIAQPPPADAAAVMALLSAVAPGAVQAVTPAEFVARVVANVKR